MGLLFNALCAMPKLWPRKAPSWPQLPLPRSSLTWEMPQAADTQEEKANQQRQAQQRAKDDASDGPGTQGRIWKTHTMRQGSRIQGCKLSFSVPPTHPSQEDP